LRDPTCRAAALSPELLRKLRVAFDGEWGMARYGIRLGTAIGAALMVTACLPVTSTSPIGTTAGYKADPQLTGMWKGQTDDSGSIGYFTFFPQKDGSFKVMLLDPPASGDSGDWMAFEIHTARLGAYQYMDVRETDDGGKPPDPRLAHVPVLYRVGENGSLVFYLMDEDAAKAAIKAGKISGRVESGDFGDVTVAAAPTALDALLGTAAGRALFTKPFATLQRINPP
jgi:hypothetical protein